jgi:hypothetical protein
MLIGFTVVLILLKYGGPHHRRVLRALVYWRLDQKPR